MDANTLQNVGLLDENAAASFFKVKPRTITEWRRRRGLPHIRISNSKVVRYRVKDLEAWISRNAVEVMG